MLPNTHRDVCIVCDNKLPENIPTRNICPTCDELINLYVLPIVEKQKNQDFDVIKAAKKLRQILVNHYDRIMILLPIPYVSKDFTLSMIDKILNGELEYSEANRFLGWIQCCLHILGVADYDKLQKINRECYTNDKT